MLCFGGLLLVCGFARVYSNKRRGFLPAREGLCILLVFGGVCSRDAGSAGFVARVWVVVLITFVYYFWVRWPVRFLANALRAHFVSCEHFYPLSFSLLSVVLELDGVYVSCVLGSLMSVGDIKGLQIMHFGIDY